jgi:heat shock protein HspQ
MERISRASFFSPQAGRLIEAPRRSHAGFGIGDIVRHKHFDFRGVVFDIDPVFANSDEWYESIPHDIRPDREQPYYHLLAENGENAYVAYVSQQNLVGDGEGGPVEHPSVEQLFDDYKAGRYRLRRGLTH